MVKWWFRNRREARFRSSKGRVSFPPGKAGPGLMSETSRPKADHVADGQRSIGSPPGERVTGAMVRSPPLRIATFTVAVTAFE
jgi:hypothetical protein